MKMLLQITEPGNTKETDQRSENVAIGIDLGTTHSVMAFIRDNVPQIIPSAEGDHLIPSVVSYIDQDVLVGKKAAEQNNKLCSLD
jgi:molecular chaperone HscA